MIHRDQTALHIKHLFSHNYKPNIHFQGAGTDESTIIEILCARTDEEIEQIKEEYKKCK